MNESIKILSRYTALVLFINGLIFPFLAVISLTALVLESTTHIGFLANHYLISASILSFLTALSAMLLVIDIAVKKRLEFTSLTKLLLHLNALVFPSLFILRELLLSIEESKYSNYVFSNFHILPAGIQKLLSLSGIILIAFVSGHLYILYRNSEKFRNIASDKPIKFEINSQVIYLRPMYLIYVFVLVSTLLGLAEAVKYPGFIEKHFMVDVRLLYAVSIMLLLHINKNNIKYVSLFIGISGLIVYLLLASLEVTNYQNFIFEKFNIHLTSLVAFVFYLGSISLSQFSRFMGIKHSQISMIVLVLLSYYLFQNIPQTFHNATISSLSIIRNLDYTYDEKMESTWHGFYVYMNFIKNNTAEDAIIATPPAEDHWLSTGNSVLVRYFLYPRKIVEGGIYNMPELEYDYAFLAKGFWQSGKSEYGWPKVALNSEKTVYLNLDTKQIEEVPGHFDPSLPHNRNSWGLIKMPEND